MVGLWSVCRGFYRPDGLPPPGGLGRNFFLGRSRKTVAALAASWAVLQPAGDGGWGTWANRSTLFDCGPVSHFDAVNRPGHYSFPSQCWVGSFVGRSGGPQQLFLEPRLLPHMASRKKLGFLCVS